MIEEPALDFSALAAQRAPSYDVSTFRGWWPDSEPQLAGDCWNNGRYVWKCEAFKSLLRQLRPRAIFEVGFATGRSASMFLNHAEQADLECEVFSIDVDHACTPYAERLRAQFPNFSFQVVKPDDDIAQIASARLGRIDLVFIDGAKETVGANLSALAPFVELGKVILIDDGWLKLVRHQVATWQGREDFTRVPLPRYEGPPKRAHGRDDNGILLQRTA